MDLSSVEPGDIIRARVRGDEFLAFVEAKDYRSLTVNPVEHRVTYRTVKSSQVVALWKKSKQGPRSRASKEATHA